MQEKDEDREGNSPEAQNNDDERYSFAGFSEKLVLLVVGFGLTTLVGGYLADQFRKESARTALELADMQMDITQSVQLFEIISQLMDKRLFRMRRMHDVYDVEPAPYVLNQKEQRLSDYRAVFYRME
jgi:hypothetical protein